MLKRIPKKISGASVDSLLLTFVQLLTYATNIVTTKLISVSLSLTDYGTFSAVNLILTLAASLTLFGLGDCLNYYYNNQTVCKDKDMRIGYVNTIYLAQFIIGIAAAVILVLTRDWTSNYFDNPFLKPLLIIICLRPLLQNATHLYQVLFVSEGRSKIIVVRNLILALLRIVIAWYAIYLHRDLPMFLVLSLASDALQLVSFAGLFSKGNFFVNIFKGSARKMPAVFSYSLPMGVYFVMNTLMREVAKMVIGGFGTQEELAIYSNCAKILPLNILAVSFATVLVPHIMRLVSAKDSKKAAELFQNYVSVGYLSIWMLGGAILIGAKEVLPFLYSDEYLYGLPIFVLYIVDTMLQFASLHLIVTANGDTKYLMKLSAAMLLINTGLNIGLYHLFDIYDMALLGPAVSTVLVTLTYNLLLIRKTVHILNQKPSEVLPIKKMLYYLVQLGVSGVVFYFIKLGLMQIGLHRYIAMFIICGGYCLLNVVLCFKEYKRVLKRINTYRIAKPSENKDTDMCDDTYYQEM